MRDIYRPTALSLLGILFAFSLGTFVGIYWFQGGWQACAPPPNVGVRGLNGQEAILLEPMLYQIGNTDEVIVVPAGFVTDYASIPQAFWSFGLTPFGQYARAAIVHDYLYWSQKCTRDQADRLLVLAMKESAVGNFDIKVIYDGVHLGGREAWSENAREKSEGLIRTLPRDLMNPENPNMTWVDYRKSAHLRGVRDATPDESGSYCQFGDTLDVPHTDQAARASAVGAKTRGPALRLITMSIDQARP